MHPRIGSRLFCVPACGNGPHENLHTRSATVQSRSMPPVSTEVLTRAAGTAQYPERSLTENTMPTDPLANVRALLLDLDGTLYLGDRLFEWTPGFLEQIRGLGLGRLFMTNNSSRSATAYREKLHRLGIDAAPEEILTSGQSAALYLERTPDVERVYVLGTPSLADEIGAAGKAVVQEGADAVLVGYPTDLTYDGLARAAVELQHGARFLATHPDRVCPDPAGMLPDCGAVCACLTTATGREPEHVFGKPSRWMVELALARTGLQAGEVAVVGDRLYTDMRMAATAGMPGVLVLSGETDRRRLRGSDVAPDLVVEHVGKLGEHLRARRSGP